MLYINDVSQYDARGPSSHGRAVFPSILLARVELMQLLYLLLFSLILVCGPTAGAQEAAVPERSAPIHIEADRMESYENRNQVIFKGRVEARQADMVIQAEQMTVFYHPTPEETTGVRGQRISKVLAQGSVRVKKEEWVATGQTLDYFAQERRAVLTGEAKVWQDNNMITGNQVTLYLDEGRTVVERSREEGERVRAFIYPNAEGQSERQ
jgi:lipopolysaccharide export system protein LptA